jgi:hypothetical protein
MVAVDRGREADNGGCRQAATKLGVLGLLGAEAMAAMTGGRKRSGRRRTSGAVRQWEAPP